MSIPFQYNTLAAITPSTNPFTFLQIVAPTNQRVRVRSIDVMPQGSTGASVPLMFDLIKQSNATGLIAEATGIAKHDPAAPETIQTIINVANGGEPTPSGLALFKFAVHQQNWLRWFPPTLDGFLWIPGGVRLGIRCINALAIPAFLSVSIEE